MRKERIKERKKERMKGLARLSKTRISRLSIARHSPRENLKKGKTKQNKTKYVKNARTRERGFSKPHNFVKSNRQRGLFLVSYVFRFGFQPNFLIKNKFQ